MVLIIYINLSMKRLVNLVCDREEISECMRQGLFDLIIWVDATGRLPEEPASSFNIDKSCADVILENNGTFEEFKEKVLRLGSIIFKN